MQSYSINPLKYQQTCALSANASTSGAALDSLCAAISLFLYVAPNWTASPPARPNERERHQSCCGSGTDMSVRPPARQAQTGKKCVAVKCSAQHNKRCSLLFGFG
jgi:hypothetical protein